MHFSSENRFPSKQNLKLALLILGCGSALIPDKWKCLARSEGAAQSPEVLAG
jgi:hypothetical protein